MLSGRHVVVYPVFVILLTTLAKSSLFVVVLFARNLTQRYLTFYCSVDHHSKEQSQKVNTLLKFILFMFFNKSVRGHTWV